MQTHKAHAELMCLLLHSLTARQWHVIAGTVESAQETASKYTQQAQDKAQDASKSTKQAATNASQQAQESTKEGAKRVQDEAEGYTESAKQATQEGVESTKNTEPAKEAGKAADKAAGAAGEYAGAAKEATVDKAAAADMEPRRCYRHQFMQIGLLLVHR